MDQTGSTFHHQALDQAHRQIRLVRIKYTAPGRWTDHDGKVTCKVKIFDAVKHPRYYALSYTWGDLKDTRTIELNGASFKVSANLHDFMTVAPRAYGRRYFWIDQVSIDQTNTIERNHQVNRMALIFFNARRVIAWLGTGSENVGSAFATLRSHAAFYNKVEKPRPLSTSEEQIWVLRQVFEFAYWSRLWIVQELRLARSLEFRSGPHTISRSQLSDGISSLTAGHTISRNKPSDGFYSVTHGEPYVQGSERTAVQHVQSLIKSSVRPKEHSIFASIAQTVRKGLRSRVEDVDSVTGAGDWHLDCSSLDYAVVSFGRQACKDSRDLIFGLHALVHPEERVPVDYAKTPEQIFVQASASFVARLLPKSHDSENLGPVSILIEGLLPNDGIKAQQIRAALIWARTMQEFRYEAWFLPEAWMNFCLKMMNTATTPEQQRLAELLHTRVAAHKGFVRKIPPSIDLPKPITEEAFLSILECTRHNDSACTCHQAEEKDIQRLIGGGGKCQSDTMQVIQDVITECGFISLGWFTVHPDEFYYGLLREMSQENSWKPDARAVGNGWSTVSTSLW